MFKTNHVYLSNTQIQILLDVLKVLKENGTKILTPDIRPDIVSGRHMTMVLDLFSRKFDFVERALIAGQGPRGNLTHLVHIFNLPLLTELCDALSAGVYPAQTKPEVDSLTVACYLLHNGSTVHWHCAGDIVGDKVRLYPCHAKAVGYLDLFGDKYRVTDNGQRAVEYWDRVSDILLRKPEPVVTNHTNVVKFAR